MLFDPGALQFVAFNEKTEVGRIVYPAASGGSIAFPSRRFHCVDPKDWDPSTKKFAFFFREAAASGKHARRGR